MELIVVKCFVFCLFLQLCGSVEKETADDNCSFAKLDLVIVLDSSGSVGSYNFQKTREFADDVINHFPVRADATRVGLVRYSTNVNTITNLNQDMDKAEKLKAVNNMRYWPGSTYTHKALQMVDESVLTPQNGDRPDVPNLVVLTTDGVSASRSKTREAVNKLKERQDIQIVVIGVGRRVNEQELLDIASRPDMVHHVTSFSKLNSIVNGLAQRICSENITKSSSIAPATTSLKAILQNQIQREDTSSPAAVSSSSTLSTYSPSMEPSYDTSRSSVLTSSSTTPTPTLSSVPSTSIFHGNRQRITATSQAPQATINPTKALDSVEQTVDLESRVSHAPSSTPQTTHSDKPRKFTSRRRFNSHSNSFPSDDSLRVRQRPSTSPTISSSTTDIGTSGTSSSSTQTTPMLSPEYPSTSAFTDTESKPSFSVTSTVSSTETSTPLKELIKPSKTIHVSSTMSYTRTTQRKITTIATGVDSTQQPKSTANSTSPITTNENPAVTTTNFEDTTLMNTTIAAPITEEPTPASQDNATMSQIEDQMSVTNTSTHGRSTHENERRKGKDISQKDLYTYLVAAAVGLIFLTTSLICMAVACKRRKRNTPTENNAGSRLRPLNNRVRYTE